LLSYERPAHITAMVDDTSTLVAGLLTKAILLRREAKQRPGPIALKLMELADRFEEDALHLLQGPSKHSSHPSTAYRLYFLDKSGICGRDDFDAECDDTAIKMAKLLADACSDRCTSFDVWQGTRQVTGVMTVLPQPGVRLSELTKKVQALTIERAEAIRDSSFAIASSRRLVTWLNGGRKKT
jgi:hypothetical protein